jgi:hypothetical protein
MKKSGASHGQSASELISKRIAELGDWRGRTLGRMRKLIKETDPEVVEEWKWRGTPIWSHDGIICTGESYKNVVKLTFMKGASLKDPARLFNSSLDGNARRAIDIHEGEEVAESAFKALFRQAVALNRSGKASKPRKSASTSTPRPKAGAIARPGARNAKSARLLSGGNPQIAKANGDAPVQAYITRMPGWKRDIGRRLDAIIVRSVPTVRKAVKWNSPFYGIEGRGWFLAVHTFTHYVKVAFFRGTSLRPVPPGASKSKETRYVDIREADVLKEAQMAAWVKQAAALPGWLR